MIPITVSFFTKQRPDGSQPTKNLSGAIAYCLGILISFTALGVLVTLIFGASGLQALATNVWVNVFLAALFIVLALSLFEVINLTLPTGLVNKIGGNSKRGGWVGPAFMGVTFSLTTFTCTVPFVGTLLIAATQGEKFYPIVGMLAFSSAFALPFFFLALFPQYLAKLPRSGSWLSVVKAFIAGRFCCVLATRSVSWHETYRRQRWLELA
jgi:thiol:disulfide interchange protein DsbD